jgi:3-oxoacyl-[acyl-carrier-protein] synthase III
VLIDLALPVRILGAGTAVPAGPPITNVDLLSMDPELKAKGPEYLQELGTRIESKFGVAQRYMSCRPGQRPSVLRSDTSEDLAFRALKAAVGGTDARRALNLLIHGTTTTSRYTGSQAASILGRIGILAPAYEVKAGCSTSLASLHMAACFLQAGYPDVAVACAETLSKVVHPDVRETWFGLADGGAAVWMAKDDTAPDFVIRRSFFSTDGRLVDLYTTRGLLPPTIEDLQSNGYCLQGDKDALGEASRSHYLNMLDAIDSSGFPLANIDWVIPHQVNRALVDDVLRARAPRASLIWDAREFGNLGGASVLFSLARCLERGAFARGERVLLMSVGGGLSSAAQVWERL